MHSDGLATVIVVNYNGEESLSGCLEALRADASPAREIIVVDNASTDTSLVILTELRARHPDVIVVWSERNVGYAGGVNLGLKAAQGTYIAVLNMDVIVDSGWLVPLIAFLEDHPEVGAVNPLIALSDRRRINALGQTLHITGLGFNRNLNRLIANVDPKPVRVTGIQGAAFVMRRALLERMGGMDVTGFLYHEDVNLSWMLNLMGLDLFCLPQSVVHHEYVLSMYPAKLHLLERNRWAMLFAYLSRATLLLLMPVLIATEALMWGYCLLRGWPFIRAKALSYRWVFRHRVHIAKRRRVAQSLRVLSDAQLLRRLRWGYAWDQFATLARERGTTLRPPRDGISPEIANG